MCSKFTMSYINSYTMEILNYMLHLTVFYAKRGNLWKGIVMNGILNGIILWVVHLNEGYYLFIG